MRNFAKEQIQGRMQKYMSKSMPKQFGKDLEKVLEKLDNTWWENVMELVPVTGDIYGTIKFEKKKCKDIWQVTRSRKQIY